MSRRVPVFSAVYLNRILHWLSPAEAIKKCEQSDAYLINGGTAIRLVLPECGDDQSPTCLTAFDARVAAGEYGPSRTARRGERHKQELAALGKKTEDPVERSLFKFRNWRLIGDDKAVRV